MTASGIIPRVRNRHTKAALSYFLPRLDRFARIFNTIYDLRLYHKFKIFNLQFSIAVKDRAMEQEVMT